MTKQQLNRDIKRLAKSIKEASQKADKSKELKPYFDFIENTAKPEFIRLVWADKSFKSLSAQSLRILIRLNVSHRFVAFHQFGLNIEL